MEQIKIKKKSELARAQLRNQEKAFGQKLPYVGPTETKCMKDKCVEVERALEGSCISNLTAPEG